MTNEELYEVLKSLGITGQEDSYEVSTIIRDHGLKKDFVTVHGGATSFVPLLYHNLGDLSRGFCHFLDYAVGQATAHQGGLISS